MALQVYFLRFFSRCARALPAADFDALPVRLSRSTFDALLAAFFPVTFRPPLDLFFPTEVIYLRLRSLASINCINTPGDRSSRRARGCP